MRERLGWLGYVLRIKDDVLPRTAIFGQPSGAKWKTSRRCLRWEVVIKKYLRKMRISGEGLKMQALNRLEWRKSVRSCIGLR